MPTCFTLREIREKYDHLAPWYDLVEGALESLGIRRLRREVLSRANGTVLEVAAGTGTISAFTLPLAR